MQESFALEHGRELFSDTLEELLNRSRVSDKSDRHSTISGGNVTVGGLDIVGNPFYNIAIHKYAFLDWIEKRNFDIPTK